jgi:cell division protein FtsB
MRLLLPLGLTLVLALGLSLALSGVWGDLHALRAEEGALEEQNRALRRTNRELAREVELLRGDPAALERVARHEYGLVRPDEWVLRLDAAEERR